MKTALRMNDPHFAMSIYEEAGDVYFKGHRNQMSSLPFFRVRGWSVKPVSLVGEGGRGDNGGLHVNLSVTEFMKIFTQDGSLPFARSIKDVDSEFRLLSKVTELLTSHGELDEALQYATLTVQVAGRTGTTLESVRPSLVPLTPENVVAASSSSSSSSFLPVVVLTQPYR